VYEVKAPFGCRRRPYSRRALPRVLVFESGDPSGAFAVSLVGSDGSAKPVTVPAAMQGRIFNGYYQDGSVVLIHGEGFGLAAYDEAHGLAVLTTAPQIFEVFGRCTHV
jgi:hypothetical protein